MKTNSLICIALSLVFAFVLVNKNIKNYGRETIILKGIPYDIRENNIAALFTMTNESGRLRNIELMKSVFEDGKLGFKCLDFHNRPSPEIYNTIKELASRVDKNGTLLLYLNSHGGGKDKNFFMTAAGGNFKFSKVLESIASVKKIKRLVVLVDTCHAEGAINEAFQGGGQLIKNMDIGMYQLPNLYGGSAVPSFMKFFEKGHNKFYYGEDSGAYEQMLIITSSSAEDLSVRGVFAMNLKKAFEKIKEEENIKVASFLKVFADLHKSGQQPYYKSIPETILSEPLFKVFPAKDLPIVDKSSKQEKLDRDYILIPN